MKTGIVISLENPTTPINIIPNAENVIVSFEKANFYFNSFLLGIFWMLNGKISALGDRIKFRREKNT